MEKPEIYLHEFDSKESICDAFSIDEHTLDNCHVYLAYYHVGSWGCDSSAFVLYENEQGMLFEVNAGHCSCCGLEDQWEPEQTCVEALEHRLEHGSLGYVGGYDDDGYENESRQVVEYLKSKSKLK